MSATEELLMRLLTSPVHATATEGELRRLFTPETPVNPALPRKNPGETGSEREVAWRTKIR